MRDNNSSIKVYLDQTDYKGVMETRGPLILMPDDPSKGRVRPEGRNYFQRHWKGSGVAQLIHSSSELQLTGTQIKVVPKRQKKKVKDHITGNKDHVGELQNVMQERKTKIEAAEAEKTKPLWKSERYKNISAKVKHQHTQRPASADGRLQRSQNVQRLPLEVSERSKGEQSNEEDTKTPRDPETSVKKIQRPASAQAGSSNNFLRMNVRSASQSRLKRPPSLTALDNLKKKQEEEFQNNHKIGQIPKYIEERKVQWEKDKHKQGSQDMDCPPGHSLLPQNERRNTLDMLKTAEQDLVKKFNSLPVRTDTFFLVNKKSSIQCQMKEVEEALKIFSRPKVFVKNDKS